MLREGVHTSGPISTPCGRTLLDVLHKIYPHNESLDDARTRQAEREVWWSGKRPGGVWERRGMRKLRKERVRETEERDGSMDDMRRRRH